MVVLRWSHILLDLGLYYLLIGILYFRKVIVHFNIPFSEISKATFFPFLRLLETIRITTKKGTLKNIPIIPQSFPIIDKTISIINGLKFRDFPSSRGSITLPTNIWIIKRSEIVIKGSNMFKNWITAKTVGKTIDKIEPKTGIKLKKKDKIPKKIERSFPKKNKIIKVNIPVIKLVIDFIWK